MLAFWCALQIANAALARWQRGVRDLPVPLQGRARQIAHAALVRPRAARWRGGGWGPVARRSSGVGAGLIAPTKFLRARNPTHTPLAR
ncbi:MAG: hypothetical protein M4D80_39380, partial [Myxococcota bacterium]|nr:hypothetical protein [Myxococcota bacterium]